MTEKAVVLFSGGMDSVTLLNLVKAQGFEIYGVSFDYGQRHKKELEFARYWAKKHCKWHKILEINSLNQVASGSALIDYTKNIPEDHYTHSNQKITVVPNRNMVMLSIAVALAENIGAKVVFYAPHKNDNAIYPDCRQDFVEALSKASQLGTYHNIRIEVPFVNLYKWQIASIGSNLKVDYHKTWSCYQGREKHCGRCATCQERKEAFKLLGKEDPTEYEVV